MGSNTLKLVIAEVHVAIGLAAVATLAATGHMDSTTAAGFIGGLLGIGITPPLVAYTPTPPPQPVQAPGVVQEGTKGPEAAQPAPTGTTGALAATPAEITGTGTSAMPAAG